MPLVGPLRYFKLEGQGEVRTMDISDIMLGIFIVAAVFETIFLRKDLERHGLHLWIYAGYPLLVVTGLAVMLRDEIPGELHDRMIFWLGAAATVVLFAGAASAFLRRR